MSNLDRWPLPAIRQNCLACCGGSGKTVIWCTCDGVHSTRCHLWPFRFGTRPDTFRARHGPELLTPEAMPSAEVNQDDLPGGIDAATEWLRARQPELVGVKIGDFCPDGQIPCIDSP